MTIVPNETEQALNRQYDVYAAAREEYRKKISEQADEIDRLRAALREHACRCEQRCVDVWEDVREHVEPTKADCRFHRARAALGEKA